MTIPQNFKFSCPECSSDIAVGVEEVVFHYRCIDPITGKLERKTTKQSDGNVNNIIVFQCTDCSWSARDGDFYFSELFSRIGKPRLDQLEESVLKRVFKNKPIQR